MQYCRDEGVLILALTTTRIARDSRFGTRFSSAVTRAPTFFTALFVVPHAVVGPMEQDGTYVITPAP